MTQPATQPEPTLIQRLREERNRITADRTKTADDKRHEEESRQFSQMAYMLLTPAAIAKVMYDRCLAAIVRRRADEEGSVSVSVIERSVRLHKILEAEFQALPLAMERLKREGLAVSLDLHVMYNSGWVTHETGEVTPDSHFILADLTISGW